MNEEDLNILEYSSSGKTSRLAPEDYNNLIDLALDTRDRKWFDKLINRQGMTKQRFIGFEIKPRAKVALGGSNDLLKLFCAGCDRHHTVALSYWKWNGDYEKPTLTPSVIVKNENHLLCRFKVKEGYMIYDSGSAHQFAGKTLEMATLNGNYHELP